MRLLPLLLLAALPVITVGLNGCGGKSDAKAADTAIAALDTTPRIPLPDTLRVATLYSPGSYFIYREEKMGYDYDLVNRLAADKHLALDLEVAPTLQRAMEMLDSGMVDLIAYEVPVTAEYRAHAVPCGPENITTQVLVQPRRQGKPMITDVTQLVGREVYVEKGSKYQHRLNNLNNEVGGGIKIHPIEREKMITEDLIALVNADSIDLTIVDSDVARINRTYYPQLDVSLEVSFPQRAQWAVAPGNEWLADSINAWLGQEQPRREQLKLLKRYFEEAKDSRHHFSNLNFEGGRISRFDDMFRRSARTIKGGWDWRMLAAMGFVESRFDSSLVSWAGARGMMQIMPQTARAYGLSSADMVRNDKSIATAARIITDLDKSLRSKVPDATERKKFVVAAYNSGIAHIYDAIALAAKYDLNPRVWDGNVERAVLMKTKPEYYNDPVCRYGYFRGRETVEYVRQVYDFYNRAIKKVKS